jgi:hypothetical protein
MQRQRQRQREKPGQPGRLCALCGALCALTTALVSCAQLLGLPDDPQLTTQPASDPEQTNSLGTNSSDTSAPPVPGVDAGGSNVEQPVPGSEPLPLETPETDTGVSPNDPVLQQPPALDAGTDAVPVAAPDAAPSEPVLTCRAGSVQGPNGNCYALQASQLPWLEARAACLELGDGWDLAAIHDADTNTFVAASFTGEAWIGGSDADVEANWIWVRDAIAFWSGDATGGPIAGAFANWNSDEPNGENDSNCVRMVATTTRWADLECEELRSSVCEGPKE